MGLIDSLLDAIVRLDGDALVMHVGEKPFVITTTSAMSSFRGPLAWGQVELSSRTLTADALMGMLAQMLPESELKALAEYGAVEFELPRVTESGSRFTAVAARGGDDIWVEVRHNRPAPPVPVEEPAAPPAEAIAPSPTTSDGTAAAVVQAPPAEQAPEIAAAEVAPPIPAAVEQATSEPEEVEAAAPEPAVVSPRPVLPEPAVVAGEPEAIELSVETEAGDEDVEIEVELPAPAAAPPPAPVAIETPTVEAEQGSAAEESYEIALDGLTAKQGPTLEIVHEDEQQALTDADVEALIGAASGIPGAAALRARLEAEAEAEAHAVVAAPRVEPAPPVPPAIVPVPRMEPAPLVEAAAPAVPVPEPPKPAVVVPLTRSPVSAERPAATVTPQGDLDRYLRIAAARGASALYLVARSRPVVRVDGEISLLDGEEPLSAAQVEAVMMDLAPAPARDALRDGAATEFVCDVPEVGRIRCMSFRDHRGPGAMFRMLPARALSAEQLGLSPEIQALCGQSDGLVVVTGPRGAGKSTLISAFVDLINRTRSDHVITIEKQITFVHESRRSFVSQREVRGETDELVAAARAALREDPDVLVVEELQSAEMVAMALEAAGSGRLVFGALPAPATTGAIERLIEQCPAERRAQAQTALAGVLRGVVAQVLLRKTRGGRVAARELLLNTPAVASLIVEGRTSQLPVALDSGRRHGMAPLNDALAGFVRSGLVNPDEAYRKAVDRDGLVALLKHNGVDTSFVERLA